MCKSKIYTHDYPVNTQMKIIKAIVLLILSITLIHCSSEEMPKPSFGGPSDGDGTPSKQYLTEFAAFPVGNIVSASKLASNSEDNLKFKEILLNDYNSITAENDMKMANIFRGPDNYDWSDGDAIVAYAKPMGSEYMVMRWCGTPLSPDGSRITPALTKNFLNSLRTTSSKQSPISQRKKIVWAIR